MSSVESRLPPSPRHPLLGTRRELPGGVVAFETEIRRFDWMPGHRIFGRVVAPLGLFGAQALAAVGTLHGDARAGSVDDMLVERPLTLPPDDPTTRRNARPAATLRVVIGCGTDAGWRPFELFSRMGRQAQVRHVSGRLATALPAREAQATRLDIDRCGARLTSSPVPEFYRRLARAGVELGTAFRALDALRLGPGEALGVVRLPADRQAGAGAPHPVMLDACFQVVAAARPPGGPNEDEPWLTLGWKRLRLPQPLPARVICHAIVQPPVDRDGETLKTDLRWYGADGRMVGEALGVVLRRASRSRLVAAATGVERLFYEVKWRNAAPGSPRVADHEPRPESGAWLLFAPGAGEALRFARDLTAALASRGQVAVLASDRRLPDSRAVRIEPFERDSWRAALAAVSADGPCRGVVHLAAVSGSEPEAAVGFSETVEGLLRSAQALSQACTSTDQERLPPLWFVTRGGQKVVSERARGLPGSLLWGFGRALGCESGRSGARLVDLDPCAPSADLLARELVHADGETGIAFRAGRRLTARLLPPVSETALPDHGTFRLTWNTGGVLEPLPAEEVKARPLAAGEVRIAVEAAGLAFHDALAAIGVAGREQPLGAEMCGRVLEVGPEVMDISPGDRVVGLARGSFGTEVVTGAELVAPAPPGLASVACATLPGPFVTAALAFELARLQAGERVLIHAAAGGVGHAAMQLADAAGLRVLATASAPKQEYLRSLGVQHVFDSRTTAFGAEILAATRGAGVAMVLNSLTGRGFIEASLSCLAAGGCFVEMGKRGIWSPERMEAMRPDIRYYVFRVRGIHARDPTRVPRVLRDVVNRTAAGELKPLPYRRWPLAQAGSAFAEMCSARHVGRIVLTPSALAAGRLRDDRSYLVTGAFHGAGLRVAGWLRDHGAAAIVMHGCTPPSGDAESGMEALRERGARVRAVVADFADPETVAQVLAGVARSALPPLGGIVHCAGVVSGTPPRSHSWESLQRVLRRKVFGAWNLHCATLDLDLDLFVLFSGFSGVLGFPGPPGEAAANAFLDQLALYRRAMGLAGQAIQWGPLSGLPDEAAESLARASAAAGFRAVTPEAGLEALTRLVRRDAGTTAVVSADWSAVASEAGPGARVLAGLYPRADRDPDPVARKLEMPDGPREGTAAFLEVVRREVRSLMGWRVLPSRGARFAELGMDSLLVVELGRRLRRALEPVYPVPNTALFDGATLEGLARGIARGFDPRDARRGAGRPR